MTDLSDFEVFVQATRISVEITLDGQRGHGKISVYYPSSTKCLNHCEWSQELDKTSKLADLLDHVIPELSRALRWRNFRGAGLKALRRKSK